uniref:Uncharacterized protein n=1 Tax=Opuntia streptacantha TaxID=393608 RepID=A0A7C9ALX3_OPUST
MPSTQTMEPINWDRRSLGVTLLETKGPSNPTSTCSPSFKYLGSILRVTSVTASEKGCIYSLGFLNNLRAKSVLKSWRSEMLTMRRRRRLLWIMLRISSM